MAYLGAETGSRNLSTRPSCGTRCRRWSSSAGIRGSSARTRRATRRTSRLSRYLPTHQASAFIKEVRVKGAICAELIAASTPINFAELERLGVLEEREGWYRLVKPNELPSHRQ